ncbi:hypothetical protein A2Z33_01985 [Candidatus Gottesmanbacteria bacterium RBG_16_52_11]|uniref:Sortase n=1 Tax=Candidatus Gottesmanbacteria bacterium RBG_16_52_11 TaxID=1798374 RepID=A0A1F5YR38_9BACT|nr:MAG: hypothetical protein A2Z33_01985 [Candidatus Gottesmanbacteria bacterium RBG_16_52_11]
MLSKSGTIYIHTKSDGTTTLLPVEVTPDNLAEQESRRYLGRVSRGQVKSTARSVPPFQGFPQPAGFPASGVRRPMRPFTPARQAPVWMPATQEPPLTGLVPFQDSKLNIEPASLTDQEFPAIAHRRDDHTPVAQESTSFKPVPVDRRGENGNPTHNPGQFEAESIVSKQTTGNAFGVNRHTVPRAFVPLADPIPASPLQRPIDMQGSALYPIDKQSSAWQEPLRQASPRDNAGPGVKAGPALVSGLSGALKLQDTRKHTPRASVMPRKRLLRRAAGIALVAASLVGLMLPKVSKIRLETGYRTSEAREALHAILNPVKPLPPAVPMVLNPLIAPDGTPIVPVNRDFAIIVPAIGINAPVIAGVDPADTKDYNVALKTGVAHASTSMTPDQTGTVYLFSHSTNYEWFVKNLNAVFYLLKNLEEGQLVVVYYKGVRYTYAMREKRIVKPTKTAYLLPDTRKKSLILQTCWPPGSTRERMLIFADLIEEYSELTTSPVGAPLAGAR